MLFSKQKLQEAFAYAAPYYDKIIEVNLNENTFNPIRINSEEWKMMPSFSSFTEWVKWFIYSPLYEPATDNNQDHLYSLIQLDEMKERSSVFICNYHKYVGFEWHVMQLEVYPATEGISYLFVRDLTKMQSGVEFKPI